MAAPTLPLSHTQNSALRSALRGLDLILPPISHTPREGGEVDFYGASDRIAALLKLDRPLHTGRNASWTHGWSGQVVHLKSPDVLVEEQYRHGVNLVDRESTAQFLRDNGYNGVAVGAPLIYADEPTAPARLPSSLLIVPPHSATFSRLSATAGVLPYVEEVVKLKSRFETVVACIGGPDVIKANWIRAFEAAGIPWVCGAWVYDRNALIRMQRIFRSFEFVTTNILGSHVAYAAYCGCRVVFHGANRELSLEDVASHPFYRQNPQHVEHLRERMFDEAKLRERFPFLFAGFEDAPDLTAWGREQIGMEHRKDAREIAKLLGWELKVQDAGWRPANELDTASNQELVDWAARALNEKRIEDVFQITNVVKKRSLKLPNVDLLRGLAFLLLKKNYPAREALKEELRHFPNNQKAKEWLEKMGVTETGVARLEQDGATEFDRFMKTVRPFTRVSQERARSLYDLACRICAEDVPGDFIECGVAAGGSTMLLALVIQAHSKRPRKLHSFDTFEGMPAPGEMDTAQGVPADETGWGTGTCAAPETFIRENCARIGVAELVVTHKGLFEHSLPVFKHETREIAFLHMDGDWYSSTRAILDHLFDKLHPDALIQIDDYGAWDGCRKALEDFEAEKLVQFDLHPIDDTGRWCRNPMVAALAVPPANRTEAAVPAPVVAVPATGPEVAHAFLNPPLELNNCDLYWVRHSILGAVKEALPLFHGTFLDIGCGVMPYRDLLTSAPSRVTRYVGLDIETPIYNAAVDLRWDGRRIPLGEASVDCAMATEVLEHCPDPLIVLQEARRVLKPGGVFFFTVPYIWPLHDAPYDFFRYTPFALEKLLGEAGFANVKVQAMGGWNASLAQMMGLWLKRAPMAREARSKMARQLWPLYQELVRGDTLPADPKAGNTMATGWTGVAYAPRPVAVTAQEVPPADLPVVLVRSHEFNYSETFVEDHVNHLTKNLTVLYGHPFPRFLKGGRSVLPEAVEQSVKSAIATGGTGSAELWGAYTAGLADYFRTCGARVALVETGLMGAYVNEACVRAALPYVVHFHGLDAFGRELLERWHSQYRNFFATAAQLIVVSKAMRTQLIALGAPAERVVLAPYGVEVELPALADPAKSEPQFIAVGRFVEKKGPHVTLRAFAAVQQRVPSARLVMIGDGPLLRPCQEWVEKSGLAGAVTFAGVQSRAEVSRQMAASRAFVQHSMTATNGDSEGLPLAVLEAGAHGLPVISTLHAGIPDAVRDRVDGFLVAEKDLQSMAAAMLRLARDPDLASRFGTAYRERIGEKYSRRRSIGRLLGLLEAAAGGRHPAGLGEPVEEIPHGSTGAVVAVSVRETASPVPDGLTEFRDEIAANRDNRDAYVALAKVALDAGLLGEAYRAIGEVHRLSGGDEDARNALQAMEGQGALKDPAVAVYRERCGWNSAKPSPRPRRLLVVTNLLPPQEMGGYGRTMWEFSRELLARGHTVLVLTADMPHLLRKPTTEHAAFEPNVRRVLRLCGDWKDGAAVVEPNAEKRRELLRHNLSTVLAAAKEFRPDAVVAGNMDFVGHFFVQELLKAGLPVLHRLGNAHPGFEPKDSPSSPLYCLAGCSEWVNENIRGKGYPIKRYAVLPPGSPLTEYFRAFPPQRARLSIAFASLLMPYKGAHLLIGALAELHRAGIEFECTLAGDSTSPDYLQKLRETANQGGFSDRIRFPGFLAKKELAALYARCNVLVFPSVFEEPFGKTQVEAMAAGLVVISSGNGGARDIIRDGETGLFFKNNDVHDLAEKLSLLQRDPALADRLGTAGQAESFRFTTGASVDHLESILEDLIFTAKPGIKKSGRVAHNGASVPRV